MLPKIRKFASTLTARIKNISFRPLSIVQAQKELIEPLQPDLQALSVTAKAFVDMGIPLNDVIKKLDLPFEEVDGGDESRLAGANAPVVPADGVDGGAPEEPPTAGEDGADGGSEAEGSEPNLPEEEKALDPKIIDTKIIRQMKWKRYDERLTRAEVKMRSVMRAFFNGQRRRVKDSLRKFIAKGFVPFIKKPVTTITIESIFDQKKEEEILKGVVKPPIKRIVIEFANDMGKGLGSELDFDFVDAKANDWLLNKVSKISQNVNNYTMESISDEIKDAIQEAVDQGYTEGESVAQIEDRIDEIYDFAVEGRSKRIAVTESSSASNYGNLEGMKMANVEKKEWLSTHDSHTRETHLGLDGQVRKVDEPFDSPSGETLMFPSDPEAEPSETVNCRCTILGVFEDDDED